MAKLSLFLLNFFILHGFLDWYFKEIFKFVNASLLEEMRREIWYQKKNTYDKNLDSYINTAQTIKYTIKLYDKR